MKAVVDVGTPSIMRTRDGISSMYTPGYVIGMSGMPRTVVPGRDDCPSRRKPFEAPTPEPAGAEPEG